MKLALATVALLFARCGAVVITMVLADSQIFEVDVPDGPQPGAAAREICDQLLRAHASAMPSRATCESEVARQVATARAPPEANARAPLQEGDTFSLPRTLARRSDDAWHDAAAAAAMRARLLAVARPRVLVMGAAQSANTIGMVTPENPRHEYWRGIPNITVEGTDYAGAAQSEAAKSHLDWRFVRYVVDAHVLTRVVPAASFDAVVCHAVLEHVRYPWLVTREARISESARVARAARRAPRAAASPARSKIRLAPRSRRSERAPRRRFAAACAAAHRSRARCGRAASSSSRRTRPSSCTATRSTTSGSRRARSRRCSSPRSAST